MKLYRISTLYLAGCYAADFVTAAMAAFSKDCATTPTGAGAEHIVKAEELGVINNWEELVNAELDKLKGEPAKDVHGLEQVISDLRRQLDAASASAAQVSAGDIVMRRELDHLLFERDTVESQNTELKAKFTALKTHNSTMERALRVRINELADSKRPDLTVSVWDANGYKTVNAKELIADLRSTIQSKQNALTVAVAERNELQGKLLSKTTDMARQELSMQETVAALNRRSELLRDVLALHQTLHSANSTQKLMTKIINELV